MISHTTIDRLGSLFNELIMRRSTDDETNECVTELYNEVNNLVFIFGGAEASERLWEKFTANIEEETENG